MDPLLLRFLERISAVLIGGMTIYLGYRLFLAVPEDRDSAGKLVLPWNIAIVMTKVGPGVFFSLFGVAAVGLALIKPLEISSQGPAHLEDSGSRTSVRYAGSAAPADRDKRERADERAMLRPEINVLNTIPQLLRADVGEDDRDDIVRGLRNTKLKLMKPVWGTPDEGFGDFSEFERWVKAGETNPQFKGMDGALALYRYGTKEPQP